MIIKTQIVIEGGKEYEVEIYVSGFVQWTLNGKLHREKGLATLFPNVYMSWNQNNLLHRIDGPALIWTDGDKRWHVNGKKFTESQHTKVRTMLSLGLDKT
jgi:hypothetical protein